MKAKARQVIQSPRLALWTLLLAVLTFNNWCLAIFFNRRLLLKGGAVSELSALNEPHALLFRVLDVLSGLLFVVAALLVLHHLAGFKTALHRVLVGATILFGVANSLDALLPLHCSETMNVNCTLIVHLSLLHPSIPSHGYSSGLIALSYLLLPLIGFGLAHKYRLAPLRLISLLVLTIAVLSLLSFVADFVVSHSWSVQALGPSQELQMVAFGLWFIALYSALLSSRHFVKGELVDVPTNTA